MNSKNQIGEFIYKRRRDIHMTQEELSFGICSVGTISRIENGSQVPSGSLLRLLLDKLGEPGFFNGLFYSKDFLEGRVLENEMLRCFENLDRNGFEAAFDSYNKTCLEENRKCRQFSRFMRYVYLDSFGGDMPGEEAELLNILKISRGDFREFSGEKTDFDRTELLILNSLALFFAGEGRTKKATKIYSALFRNLLDNKTCFKDFYKAKAALFNNLALVKALEGNISTALRTVNKAFDLSNIEGGAIYRLKIMVTRAFINEIAGKSEEAFKDRYMINMSLSELVKNKDDLWDSVGLFDEKKGIVVF